MEEQDEGNPGKFVYFLSSDSAASPPNWANRSFHANVSDSRCAVSLDSSMVNVCVS